MIHQQGNAFHSCVVEHFNAEDFGAPFKIILKDCVSVTEDDDGNMISYHIPDPEGLLRTVVFARVLNPRKLSGADIKFLRKAVGVKQKVLAKAIEVDPATLSRCENGMQPLGPASEKLLRIFLVQTGIKFHKLKECEAKTKLEEVLSELFDVLKPSPVHSADDDLELYFVRESSSTAGNDNSDSDGDWEADKATGTR